MRHKSCACSALDKLISSLTHSATLFPFLENSFEMKRQMALFKENVIKRNELLCQKLASAHKSLCSFCSHSRSFVRPLVRSTFALRFVQLFLVSVLLSAKLKINYQVFAPSLLTHTQTTQQMCSIFLGSQVECKFYATES